MRKPIKLIQLFFASGSKINHSLFKLPMSINIILLQLVRQLLFNIIFILLKLGFYINTTQFK